MNRNLYDKRDSSLGAFVRTAFQKEGISNTEIPSEGRLPGMVLTADVQQ